MTKIAEMSIDELEEYLRDSGNRTDKKEEANRMTKVPIPCPYCNEEMNRIREDIKRCPSCEYEERRNKL